MRPGYAYSEGEYFDFVRHRYAANAFESEDDARFVPGSHNAWVNGQRFHRMLQCLSRHLGQLSDPSPLAVDIGFYPGTWISLARHFWPDIRWHGVGLCISEAFLRWSEAHDIAVSEADMDPFYAPDRQASRLPFADASVELIVASEIFEHLISPLVFLEEAGRVLKPGGLMLITTPNVSNAGAVLMLLRGDSNHERLLRSPMFLIDDEWRGHIRFYSKAEMRWLGERYGFEMIDHRYYHDDYPLHVLRHAGGSAVAARLIRRIVGVVPWFRGGQVMMFRRQQG